MNVAILSMQRVNNYGSLLQAFALKSIVETKGHTVQFIDIKRNDSDNKLLSKETLGKYSRHSDDSLGRRIDKYVIARLINSAKTHIMLRKMEQFRKRQLGITRPYNPEIDSHYELCVIGADEVFNCMQESPWGFTTQLYGNVPEADRVITYAASCGNTSYDMLTSAMREAIKKTFESVTAFSVRDDNTFNFVKKIAGINSLQHFDPALIFDFSPYIHEPKRKLPQHYCLLYAYDKRIKKPNEIIAIQELCRRHRLKLIIAYGGQLWNTNLVPFSPFELLYAFQNADMVLTDTFHGAIFSIKYAKRFGIICRESNRNKLMDLLKRTGTDEHLIKDMNNMDRCYNVVPNRSMINSRIDDGYKRTVDYLTKNL